MTSYSNVSHFFYKNSSYYNTGPRSEATYGLYVMIK